MDFFSKEGKLTTGTTILYSAEKQTIIKMIRFNNTQAFNITLFKITGTNTSKIWSLELNAGDTITDTFEYVLEPKSRLEITCNVAGTSYSLSGQTI